ncbi:MAG TPA: 50S ribosomal protein L25/general stress protein Ctc [Deltaproteobacteria bacterium]|nr:50S ribosomal protein L25/general stress protein Ctc [Deltaproteobacteria bacterium]
MERRQLEATPRKELGKGPCKRLRRQGFVPAIFYGHKEMPIPLAIRVSDLKRLLAKPEARASFIELRIRGEDGNEIQKLVLLKEIQRDPIKDTYLHVDLYGVAMDEEIYMEVPIHLVGRPVGVEKGGILEQILREVEVKGLPGDIPPRIDVDVSSLDIGDAIHVEDLHLEKIKVMADPDQAIATVIAPTVEEEEIEEAEEGEVTEEG